MTNESALNSYILYVNEASTLIDEIKLFFADNDGVLPDDATWLDSAQMEKLVEDLNNIASYISDMKPPFRPRRQEQN